VAPKTEAFVAAVERLVAEHGVETVSFTQHQRKDEVTRQFDADESVMHFGRAKEKTRVVHTERRRCVTTGMSCPRVVDGSAMGLPLLLLSRGRRLRPLLPEVLFVLPLQLQAVLARAPSRRQQLARSCIDDGVVRRTNGAAARTVRP
jgi:hypothetical protein